MALGDYANSRGAADMGILPDRLPGYAHLSDSAERARFGKLWGGEISATPGLTARAMMEAAVAGKLKALYVVGANPLKTFGVAQPDRLAGLELLVVHDMFLTETAQRADVVLPAASTYEKDGTLTNTAGEVQLTHRSIDPQGPRSDFDLLRILSHQLSMLGLGTPIRLRTPEAAFDEIRQNVAGYDLSPTRICWPAAPSLRRPRCKARRGVLRRARGHSFLFTGLFVYERHPGPLLFQAHFDERGKTDAVEFISQHPVLVVSVVKIAVLLFIVMTALAYLTWLERKVIAHIQSRWGPYNVGAHGLLQPLADGIKFLFKEDVTPPAADRLIYTLAPFLALALGLSAIALIPFGPPSALFPNGQQIFSVVDLNIGLLFLFAITSMGVYGVALAGWSSNSKYALLGGLRSSAQMISYEVSLTISVVGVMLLAGTLNFNEHDRGTEGLLAALYSALARASRRFVGFLCYLTAAIAETNRVPFDLPEAETELVAGFHTEYSSFKFAMFFMAEYANMITVSCLATILFLGGWLSPFPDTWTWQNYLPGAGLLMLAAYCAWNTVSEMRGIARLQLAVVTLLAGGGGLICLYPPIAAGIQGPFWFTTKILAILFFYIWMRATLPRFRYDQLMSFGWKLLLPVSLANLVITAFVIIWPLLRKG